MEIKYFFKDKNLVFDYLTYLEIPEKHHKYPKMLILKRVYLLQILRIALIKYKRFVKFAKNLKMR